MTCFARKTGLLSVCLGALCAGVALPAFAIAAPAAAGEHQIDRAQTIVVGRVSMNPKKQLPGLEVLANYLAERLPDVGIRRGVALVAKDNAEMIGLLRDGAVDLFSETVFSGLYFAEEGDAEFLLREWKKGVAEYRSIFFARRDSDIRTIEDLRGRKIAFEDRGSTSGFLLPLAILKRHGLEAAEIPPAGPAQAGRVSYAFAISEVNIAAWVARGIADVGAFSSQDWEDVGRTPAPIKMDLVTIYESDPIMRSAVLVRTGLRPELKSRIKQILLQLHDDPVGRDMLERYNQVSKYDEIAGDAARGLEIGRRLYPLVREEVR